MDKGVIPFCCYNRGYFLLSRFPAFFLIIFCRPSLNFLYRLLCSDFFRHTRVPRKIQRDGEERRRGSFYYDTGKIQEYIIY